jgi:alpha-tubulin suppressor-like RCC1 family protein
MIGSVLEGYNATLFAYGQTTSGKTHTMVGSEDHPGLIPLTVQDLFKSMERAERVYRVWVSYLEIYNEVANDLLQPRSINLKLRESPAEGCYVLGLKQVRVFNAADVMQLLEIGERNKHYRETKIHDHSSRSHSVFKLMIDSSERGRMDLNEDDETKSSCGIRASVFNLVDLAGSERLNDSGSSSVTETSHINKSLFVLTKVINKLADGPVGHIPYRDSKLTRILSNALGGNSLTAIICTIAPAAANISLSLSTLRFASRAKSIVNKPIINEILDDTELLESLKAQIRRLEKQLADKEAICELEHSKLIHENADLRGRLELKEQNPQVLHEVKFLNVEVSDLMAKHAELQRNFDIQLNLRCELLRENGELKSRGKVGFDMQRQRVENERKDVISKVRIEWTRAVAKLRNDYLMELSALDELFYEQMCTWLESHASDLKENQDLVVSTAVSRSRKSRKQIEAPKGTPTKPPSRPGTSLKSIRSTISNRTVEPMNGPRPRSSARRSIPIKGIAITPPPPKREKRYLVLESDSGSNSGFSDGETSASHPIQKETEEWKEDNSESVSPDHREEDSKRPEFLPLPIDEDCKESIGAVVITVEPGCNVLMYGMNKDGCCGTKGTALQCSKPVSLPAEFVSMSLGNSHSAAIDYQGVLFTFGRGRNGQLGQGNLTNSVVPQPVTHPLHGVPVRKVSCGSGHTLCVTMDGLVYSWGFNEDGQLGLGDQYDRFRPFLVSYLTVKVKDVEAGYYHSAAITEEGALYTWGANPDGRLFRPPIRIRYQKFKCDTVPTKVHDLADVASLSLGKTHSILLTTEGIVYTAGTNNHGELGANPNAEMEQAFFRVATFSGVLKGKSVGCGDSFSLVLTHKRTIYTFGKGGDGRLGLGGTSDQCIPQCVAPATRFKKAACGSRHVLAIREDDELMAWGCGTYSQLCTETDEDLLVPTLVDLSSKTGCWARDVISGHYHSAVITV